MGRIRTVLVKRIARHLVRDYETEVSGDFAANKEVVAKHTNISSPKMKNVVAGYATRMIKLKNAAPKKPKRSYGKRKEDISKFYKR